MQRKALPVSAVLWDSTCAITEDKRVCLLSTLQLQLICLKQHNMKQEPNKTPRCNLQ